MARLVLLTRNRAVQTNLLIWTDAAPKVTRQLRFCADLAFSRFATDLVVPNQWTKSHKSLSWRHLLVFGLLYDGQVGQAVADASEDLGRNNIDVAQGFLAPIRRFEQRGRLHREAKRRHSGRSSRHATNMPIAVRRKRCPGEFWFRGNPLTQDEWSTKITLLPNSPGAQLDPISTPGQW